MICLFLWHVVSEGKVTGRILGYQLWVTPGKSPVEGGAAERGASISLHTGSLFRNTPPSLTCPWAIAAGANESERVSRSVMSDSATPWTVAHQAPLSMEFSRQEYWSGLPFSSPGESPHPGIEPGSSCIAGRFFAVWTWLLKGRPQVQSGEDQLRTARASSVPVFSVGLCRGGLYVHALGWGEQEHHFPQLS